jgi:hypothetical protein
MEALPMTNVNTPYTPPPSPPKPPRRVETGRRLHSHTTIFEVANRFLDEQTPYGFVIVKPNPLSAPDRTVLMFLYSPKLDGTDVANATGEMLADLVRSGDLGPGKHIPFPELAALGPEL